MSEPRPDVVVLNVSQVVKVAPALRARLARIAPREGYDLTGLTNRILTDYADEKEKSWKQSP
jgi:hypothetical protein